MLGACADRVKDKIRISCQTLSELSRLPKDSNIKMFTLNILLHYKTNPYLCSVLCACGVSCLETGSSETGCSDRRNCPALKTTRPAYWPVEPLRRPMTVDPSTIHTENIHKIYKIKREMYNCIEDSLIINCLNFE